MNPDWLTTLVERYAHGPEDRELLLQVLGVVQAPSRRCMGCGGRLRADNKYGACTRNRDCRRIHQRRQFRVLNGVVKPYKD